MPTVFRHGRYRFFFFANEGFEPNQQKCVEAWDEFFSHKA